MNRGMLLGMVVLGAVAGGGGMWLADRVAPGELGVADRAKVERVVHDYVLAHPEIIPAALQKMQDRETGKTIEGQRAAIEKPYGSAWIGNPKGDVVLVEYFDYNCGFCRASLPVIRQLVQRDPRLKIVFRELPILSDSSHDAARASLAASAQGKFARFHDALYAAGPVSAATIAAAARAAGVDPAKVPADADAEIKRNYATARALGFSGTPSWVVGGRVLAGAQPLDQLQAAIADARSAK